MDGSDDPRGADLGGRLALSDWRRRVADLYAAVRALATSDPAAAHARWTAERERLFREHPESPVPAGSRATFRLATWPYDPALRFEVVPEAAPDVVAASPLALPNSGSDLLTFHRIGRVALPLPDGPGTLGLYWMAGYAGGLFLPFRDATSGHETYGAGRYLLDTAKGADLGPGTAAGTLVVDLNFAYHPSCAFDPRWACPLAGPDDRLGTPVRAGERLG